MMIRFAILLLLLLAQAAEASVVAIPRNSVWKYLAGPDSLPDTWRTATYNDSAWSSGPGIFGYNESYISTQLPYGGDPNNKWRTTYFRKTFTVGVDPSTIQAFALNANFDDGFVAYLNGIEALRASIPAGPVTYSTLATTHEGGAYEGFDLTSKIGMLVQGTNLLAVEMHQTTASSPDLVHDMELIYGSGPSLVRGPYLQRGTSSRITIRWRTDLPTDSRVRFGTSLAALTGIVDNAAITNQHEVTLTGLSARTKYFYTVGSSTLTLAGGDSSYSFVTAPAPGTSMPIRAWIIGDSGQPGADLIAVRDAYRNWSGSRATDLWLMLGDNAYNNGNDAQYQAGVFDAYPEMLRGSVLWPTRGNHDNLFTGPDNDYYDIFTLPKAGEAGGMSSGSEAYYSFDYGNIHFICLDSEGSDRTLGGPMAVWLRSDLAATQREWIVAFWHHPPYTKGSHDSDNTGDSGGRMHDMRQNFLPILDSTGVDLVLTGHSHSYERSFLLTGHYGISSTLTSAMKVDSTSGRIDGTGAYQKAAGFPSPGSGAVYTVAGSSSKIGGGTLNHPVMISSLNVLGSLVLDVDGSRLDARFLDSSPSASVLDSFTILKDSSTGVPERSARSLRLGIRGPNPFAHGTALGYDLARAGMVRLTVYSADGRRVARLVDRIENPGPHVSAWDGRDRNGRDVAAGIYFAVIEHAGQMRAVRLVRLR